MSEKEEIPFQNLPNPMDKINPITNEPVWIKDPKNLSDDVKIEPDYKSLLEKYVKHVIEIEGSDFLDSDVYIRNVPNVPYLTEDEAQIIRVLVSEEKTIEIYNPYDCYEYDVVFIGIHDFNSIKIEEIGGCSARSELKMDGMRGTLKTPHYAVNPKKIIITYK